MNPCDATLAALALEPEDGLAPDVRAHLSACAACRDAARDLVALRGMAGRSGVSAPEPDLDRLAAEGSRRQRREARRSWAGTLAAMAAGFLLGISLHQTPRPTEAPPPAPSREEIREAARRIKAALAPPRPMDRIVWAEPTCDPNVTITYTLPQGG